MFSFGGAQNGVTFGRYQNSVGEVQYPPQITAALGATNSGPRVGPVVINEIQYHPQVGGDEFVELKNLTDQNIPLYDPLITTNRWKLTGLDYTLPSGAVTKETAAQTGALLGAQVLITGDITGFTYQKSGLGGALTNIVKGLSVAAERVTAEVIIDLRIIDASTGEVLMSHKGVGKASQTGIAADLTKDEKNYSGSATLSTPLGQASRQALQNGVAGILLGMPKVRWGGRIVDVREGVVYLNSGVDQGMRVGMELDVYEVQPALVDPETGRNLGAPDKLIGTLVVTSVLGKFSTARMAGGDGFSRGNIVRMKAGNPPPP